MENDELTPLTPEELEAARAEKARYMREWRKAHPDSNARYWAKRAARLKAEREAAEKQAQGEGETHAATTEESTP